MDILVHAKLSVYHFGGKPEDYIAIHKFIDASKLFYFHFKHRSMLHHTFGIELCTELFGDTICNSDQQEVVVRDIAAAHIQEDLDGHTPTLAEWFERNPNLCSPLQTIEAVEDETLKNFLLKPYLHSGIQSSLMITYSDFGVWLCERFLGTEKALILRKLLPKEQHINQLLQQFRCHKKWQFTPQLEKLELIK